MPLKFIIIACILGQALAAILIEVCNNLKADGKENLAYIIEYGTICLSIIILMVLILLCKTGVIF